MAQVALAWVMNRPGVSAPVVGTTSLENLKDLIGKYLFYRVTVELIADRFSPFAPYRRGDALS